MTFKEDTDVIGSDISDLEEEIKECRSCKIAVGSGMYIDVCKELEDTDLDCDELYTKVTNHEMTLHELFTKIRDQATSPAAIEKLDHIDSLMGVEIESLKGKNIEDLLEEE